MWIAGRVIFASPMRGWPSLLSLAITCTSCTGNIFDPKAAARENPAGGGSSGGAAGENTAPAGGDASSPCLPTASAMRGEACPNVDPAMVPAAPNGIRVWRLTRAQYNNTVHDLLGDETAPADKFIPDPAGAGFSNNATLLGVGDAQAVEFEQAAQKLAQDTVTSRLAKVLPCPVAQVSDDLCGRSFVQSFGKKAFRRPLTDEEVTSYFALYTQAKQLVDATTGVAMVIETMLQSPHFLFRSELGDSAQPGQVRLTPYEIATALSYYLWDTMPDDELVAAADQGKLSQASEVANQAQRLLVSSRAHATLLSFYDQLLDYDLLRYQHRDTKAFPDFEAQKGSMQKETHAFVESVVFGADARLTTLLTAPYSFLDASLAKVYGVAPPMTDFTRVALDPQQRAGILTQIGVLAAHATPLASSPPRRGKLISEKFLCHVIPPPPDNIPPLSSPGNVPKTTRQMFELHTSTPTCKACHSVLDPLGFPFETFDAEGQYRTEESGVPIDPSAALPETVGLTGTARGVVQLASKLAQSDVVKRCMVTQTFRFAFGRNDTTADQSSLASLEQQFLDHDTNLKQLFLSVALQDTFVTRLVP